LKKARRVVAARAVWLSCVQPTWIAPSVASPGRLPPPSTAPIGNVLEKRAQAHAFDNFVST